MTETERQKVDQEADQSLKQCEATISQLQAKLTSQKPRPQETQLLDHRSRVLLYLLDLYSRVSTAYFKQKSDRLENALEERQGYTKSHAQALLDSRSRVISSSSFLPKSSQSNVNSNPYALAPADSTSAPHTAGFLNEGDSGSRASVDNLAMPEMDVQLQEQLSKENRALQTSLANMSDDIRQVEQQMIVISQAQQLIAHNLMQQRDDLEQIHKQTKDSTMQISKGNTELEKAAQSGSKFRIFVLIFLLSMSFSLLFLHFIES